MAVRAPNKQKLATQVEEVNLHTCQSPGGTEHMPFLTHCKVNSQQHVITAVGTPCQREKNEEPRHVTQPRTSFPWWLCSPILFRRHQPESCSFSTANENKLCAGRQGGPRTCLGVRSCFRLPFFRSSMSAPPAASCRALVPRHSLFRRHRKLARLWWFCAHTGHIELAAPHVPHSNWSS